MQSNATLNPILSTVAGEFMRDMNGYVGFKLFPVFNAGDPSGDYYVFPRGNALNLPRNIRHSPGAPFSRSLQKVSDDNYACKDAGHEEPVPDTIRRKYANRFDADKAATKRLTDIIKLNHELRVKDLIDAASLEDATPTIKWNEPDSDPRADVNAAKEYLRLNCGLRPNLMVISEPVRLFLEGHPAIMKFYSETTPGLLPLAKLAAFFNVGEIAVAEQVINTANEGQALTPADIWDDTVILARVDSSQDLMVPSFGRTFNWSEMGAADGTQIFTYRDEPVESTVHRVRHFTDEKIVAAHAAYRLENVLA